MEFISDHIAPCGINCATCLGFLRNKNKCVGCKIETGYKPYHCQVCSIKQCSFLAVTSSKLCYECEKYPCTRLKQLDKRYRTKYNSSLMGNLEEIKRIGFKEYLKKEETKWRCNNCGDTICVHTNVCYKCSNKN